MYKITRGSLTYIVTDAPTPEQLAELGCDSYELYEEPIEQQKTRVKQSLISTPDLSSVDLEGVIFSDIEIGDIIQERVFGGNPHAEPALQAKTSAYLLSVVSGDTNAQLLEEITVKRSQINEIRTKFNLKQL